MVVSGYVGAGGESTSHVLVASPPPPIISFLLWSGIGGCARRGLVIEEPVSNM